MIISTPRTVPTRLTKIILINKIKRNKASAPPTLSLFQGRYNGLLLYSILLYSTMMTGLLTRVWQERACGR